MYRDGHIDKGIRGASCATNTRLPQRRGLHRTTRNIVCVASRCNRIGKGDALLHITMLWSAELIS